MATAQAEAYRPTPRDQPAVLLQCGSFEGCAVFGGRFEIGCQARSSSNSALAAFKSSVSKPSVNQP